MQKILLVEDDPIESRLYVNLFTKEGFDIRALASGLDCVSTAVSFNPDVILLDIMMPGKNGYEVLDSLHNSEQVSGIPVVMLTNLSDDHFVEEAKKRGAVLFITKSNIENSVLISKVTDVINTSPRKKRTPSI
jgi:CheY-like chemotaxis protein